ncbi:hypothetical protein IC582_000084 [Cucumis melo]
MEECEIRQLFHQPIQAQSSATEIEIVEAKARNPSLFSVIGNYFTTESCVITNRRGFLWRIFWGGRWWLLFWRLWQRWRRRRRWWWWWWWRRRSVAIRGFRRRRGLSIAANADADTDIESDSSKCGEEEEIKDG